MTTTRPEPDGLTFAALLAEPGVEEVCELRSPFGFMAYHGGALEQATDVVAAEAAARCDASLYAVLQPPGMRWHLPSTSVDPAASSGLRSFVDHVEVAVSLHGFGRHGFWTTLLLGGTNRALAEHLAAHLGPALPGYVVATDLEAIPSPLRGLHPANPVNLARGGGVQVELPPRVRGTAPTLVPPLEHPPTIALIEALAAAARSWSSDDLKAPAAR